MTFLRATEKVADLGTRLEAVHITLLLEHVFFETPSLICESMAGSEVPSMEVRSDHGMAGSCTQLVNSY